MRSACALGQLPDQGPQPRESIEVSRKQGPDATPRELASINPLLTSPSDGAELLKSPFGWELRKPLRINQQGIAPRPGGLVDDAYEHRRGMQSLACCR